MPDATVAREQAAQVIFPCYRYTRLAKDGAGYEPGLLTAVRTPQDGPSEGIRTPDLLLPKQARY